MGSTSTKSLRANASPTWPSCFWIFDDEVVSHGLVGDMLDVPVFAVVRTAKSASRLPDSMKREDADIVSVNVNSTAVLPTDSQLLTGMTDHESHESNEC
jgi:hypothetical protein